MIGSILCRIGWNDIWEYHINHQPPDIACRFQSTVLLLLIQIYGTPALLEVGFSFIMFLFYIYKALCSLCFSFIMFYVNELCYYFC